MKPQTYRNKRKLVRKRRKDLRAGSDSRWGSSRFNLIFIKSVNNPFEFTLSAAPPVVNELKSQIKPMINNF